MLSNNKILRQVAAVGAILGATAGGFAVASAATGKGESDGVAPPTTIIEDVPLLFIPSLNNEPTVFDGDVSAVNAGLEWAGDWGSTIRIYKSSEGICQDVSTEMFQMSGCHNEASVLAGVAHQAWITLERIYVAGVVPDDVATVEINGESVPILNNTWQYSSTQPDEAMTLVTRSADGTKVGEIG